MSITTELRKYASSLAMKAGASTTEVKGALEEIADRIDQEHEECEGFCRRLEDAASKGEEVTLFGTDYIPMPKDADGEPWHIGDMTGRGRVTALHLVHDDWFIETENEQWELADSIAHVQPDSWERIIEDAQADGVRYHNDGRPSDFDALVERCKRLAGEDA